MKILSMPKAESHTYDPTGLSVISNRCTINSGGFYVSGSTVYVDITITLNATVNNGQAILRGFPSAAAVGTAPLYDITPVSNHIYLYYDTLGGPVDICPDATITSGTTIRYIATYTKN